MSVATRQPPREDVLDAFAVEKNPDRPTLERYLQLYPEYAGELIDLARELTREICEDTAPLSAEDQVMLDTAWKGYTEAMPASATDPFSSLTTAQLRDVAQRLDVPRQVVTALRERRVLLATIPQRFVARLAEAVSSSIEQLEASWTLPRPALARSYKADGKPAAGEQVSFERVLTEAGVPADKRAQLLADMD